MRVTFYSTSDTFKEETVTLRTDLLPESMSHVCVKKIKWLACVIEIIQKDSQVKLTLLDPYGPSSSFKYPETEEVQHTSR